MTELRRDRWQRLERIYHEALAVSPPERAAFLRQACPDDTAMVREIAGLLELEEDARTFLERPALEEAAAVMTLTRGAFTGRQIGKYDVVSLLGAGGMGEVYLARDRRLGREVALKFLHPAVAADALDLRRFEEEARAASILNHTNIVTIFGGGEDDGVAFIEMERVHGRTLREHMADGPLLVPDLLDVAIQLADALTHAHQNGIVHRDLKPENVMMTPDGVVKVLDFGIAKRGTGVERLAGRADADPQAIVTLHGAILGTVGYMSPEQAAGQPVRPASDQFSLGAILYELATGQRAFEKSTPTATIDAILHEQPTPIRRLQPEVPPALQQAIERCLSKQPEARFAATRDLADALRRVRAAREHAARMRASWRRVGQLAVASVVILLLGGLAAWQLWWREPPKIPFAVLPFSTVQADEDIAYLGEGMADALNQRLRELPGLDVANSEKALSFANATVLPDDVSKSLDPQTLADLKGLGAQTVLIGSIDRPGERLRIKAALVDVASGTVSWTPPFDRGDRGDLEDWMADAVVDAQDDIAKAVVRKLKLRVSEDVLKRLTERPTRDNIAYNLYLRGLYRVRRGEPLEARDLLKQAMDRDARFAAVRVAYARTYWTMLIDGDLRPAYGWKSVNTAVDEAMRIDPGLPAAHAGRAMFSFLFNHDWAGAEAEWETARRLSARNIEPETYFGWAFQQWAIGNPQRALDLIKRARSLNPFDSEIKRKQADYHLHVGDLEEAAVLYREIIDDDSGDDTDALFGLAEVQKRLRQYDEAIETLRGAHEILDTTELIPSLATARGEAGLRAIEHETALLDVRTHEERARVEYVSPYELARVYARAGQRAKALDRLEEAERENSPGLVFIGADRSWDTLRQEPRFRAVLESVGLPKRQ